MRLLFLRATGLGDLAAEPGQIVPVDDPARAQALIVAGRAVSAPEVPASEAPEPEPQPEVPEPERISEPEQTPEPPAPEVPAKPKKGGRA